MIFRQLFESVSSTYSYLLAGGRGGEALIIDPMLDKVDHYLQLIRELDVKLVKAVDTHTHAGRARRRNPLGVSYPGRHRRLEKGEGACGPLILVAKRRRSETIKAKADELLRYGRLPQGQKLFENGHGFLALAGENPRLAVRIHRSPGGT